jgi:hypothetical protein
VDDGLDVLDQPPRDRDGVLEPVSLTQGQAAAPPDEW